MPVYNKENYLKNSIYSLLKQDGNDYYIEVSSEVMNYSNVSLKIRIRDYEYLYSLKES